MNTLNRTVTALLLGAAPLSTALAETIAPVIVTATRTAQGIDESLASVTVISQQEIARSQSHSVVELLRSRSVGIDLSRSGGIGSTTGVLIRGSNSNHLLVLIDGVRANSAIDGDFKWNNLPLEQIERIEIVRGPRSTLYGSDAIGGVVQIFTRRGDGLQASIGGGSYETSRASIGLAGELGAGRYHLNGGYLHSSGYSAKKPGSYNYEPDDDGYRNANLGAGIDYPLGEQGELQLKLLHSNGDSDYDAGSASQRNDTLSLGIDWAGSDNWLQKIGIGHAADHYETGGYKVHSLRDSINWQHDLQFGDDGLLSAGIEYSRVRGESEGDAGYDETLDNRALFAQYQWQGTSFDLLLGGRSDDEGEDERRTTGNLTLGTRLGQGRLYLSYGSAFKTPTFLQRYYPESGNPDLAPEESLSGELGYRLGGLQASLYDTRVKNLIEWSPEGYLNVSRAHLQGLELEYSHTLGSWRLNGGLTLQKAEDEKSGDELLRRAGEKLFVTASGPVSADTELGIEASYTGARQDRGDIELDAFTLLNLTAHYRINPQWSFSGRIENLLDADYTLASGYNTAGRSAYANVSLAL